MSGETSVRPPDDADSPEAWLPWYLNGTLDAERRAQVQAWLAEQPDQAERLAFERRLADTLSARVAELPADVGLDRLMSRIGAETARPAPSRPPGLTGRLLGWLTLPTVATGMTAAVAIQLGAIALLVDRPAPDTYRSAGPAHAVTVRVSFKPDVTESQLRELLLRSGASIVGGPNQLGEYWLASRDASIDSLADALRSHPLVQSLTVDREGPDAQR